MVSRVDARLGYVRLVNAEAGRVEAVLKMLLSPPDEVDANFAALTRGGDKALLTRIREIKGLKQPGPQVFDVAEEARSAGQALSETVRGRLDQTREGLLKDGLLKTNLDWTGKVASGVVGQVAGHVSSTVGAAQASAKSWSQS
ncbi:hypothetical protein T484DRAFT_1911831 [Baffinella frigidus]|nr:hypothetical protein T484DRAFT_1911831 [Cryptophyta sp. CCMP2293]